MVEINKISKIRVGLASPETIRKWSHGEVMKPETINYRSQKPEMQGLFCEKIFGPSKDYECHCGKYKKQRYVGVVCEKCGVEVMTKDARRERMGHIELATPCAHIWYVKGIPSRIALILDINAKQLEELVYLVGSTLICLNAGQSKILKYRQVIDEKTGRVDFVSVIKEFQGRLEGYEAARAEELVNRLENRSEPINFEVVTAFIQKHLGSEFGEGAEAIKRLLKEIDLEKEFQAINKEMVNAPTQRRNKLIKRLELVDSFRLSNNRPEWMILDVLPVIPPDLRPMLQLDGGRFATSDLNDLYRRLIARNRRLKNLINMNAPSTMLRNEKRMLQEAVDALIDNGRRGKPVLSSGGSGRELKSLSSALKGKQGRFRQNLLGKRVDYSGRSVIAVGPDLKMYQCGLPREMAIQLLKPFIASLLIDRGYANSHKQAEKKVENYDEIVFDIVEEIISFHPVLLNRAPTLHRLGIQAFQPKLVEGRAIRLHPLVTTGFNADFDGDQMAVHVPLSKAAQEEAVNLMLASNNILGPKDGLPIATPSQDMVIGNFYLTMENTKAYYEAKAAKAKKAGDEINAEMYEAFANGEGKVFKDLSEIVVAYQTKQIHLHNRIAVPGSALKKTNFTPAMNEGYLLTTVGKMIFNSIFPSDFPYINNKSTANIKGDLEEYFVPKGTDFPKVIAKKPMMTPLGSKDLSAIIKEVFARYGTSRTSVILDKMKDQGFKYATVSGLTVALSDIVKLENKQEIIDEGDRRVEEITDQFNQGLLTDEERYNLVVQIWKEDVQKKIASSVLALMANKNDNPLNIIFNSGARGKASNFNQLIGYRGLMSKPNGKYIELPIRSSFREGLSISEFFIATHGARKVGADTALKTADSGYLTRKLCDVSQDVIIREADCGTDHGTNVYDIKDTARDTIITPLLSRLVGRFNIRDVIHPKTKAVIVEGDRMMDERDAKLIVDAGITDVEIRSVIGCESKGGICQKCYGRHLATGKLVEIGDAVGIMAAQSIGEPGTQLTMRTFHEGGVAGRNITDGLPRVGEIFEARRPKGEAVISSISGKVVNIEDNNGRYKVTVKNDLDTLDFDTPFGSRLRVKVGDKIVSGTKISEGAVYPKDLLKYADMTAVQKYIIKEVQKVYQSNGASIADKHIEVIIRQMTRKVLIIDGGDTDMLTGSKVDTTTFTEKNEIALLSGKNPAVAMPRLLGITKASLETESFLSAASFQETTKVLTDAAIKGKTDVLHGLKENVITGKLIPAGRGLFTDAMKKTTADNFTVEQSMRQIKANYRSNDEQYLEKFEDFLED